MASWSHHKTSVSKRFNSQWRAKQKVDPSDI